MYASLEKVDPRLIEAGADLYAAPFTAFRKITLPLSMPGLVAGTLLTFIPAAGDYINSELLGNPQTRMIGNEIQDLFGAGDYPTAAALSVALMATIVLMVFFYVRRAGTEELVDRRGRWLGDHLILMVGLLVLLYMFTPVFVVMLMSFNDPASRNRLQLRRVHARQLAQHLCAVRHVRVRGHQPADRAAGHAAGHPARHADGVRDGAAPVPRPARRTSSCSCRWRPPRS